MNTLYHHLANISETIIILEDEEGYKFGGF